MTIDPFAAPVEEAQQPEPEAASVWDDAPKSVGTVSVDVKPNILPATAEKLVVTLKGGSGFDAPWIVYHAASVDDALTLFNEDAAKLADLMGRVQKAGSHFAANGSKSSAGGGNTGGRGNAPQGATEAPAWAPPKPYDDFVYKTGVSRKNGKTWHAWMPPEKDDPREPKFFYAN